MLKNRSFLKGMGTGLIAGALLLQLMIMVRDAENRVNQPAKVGDDIEITAKLVREKADELNLKVFDKNEKVYDQKHLDDVVSKAVEAAKAEAASTPGVTAPKQVTVYITNGMAAVNVIELLYNSGVVVDRMGLEQAIVQGQYSDKLHSGLYTFNVNENITDVITKITKPPR